MQMIFLAILAVAVALGIRPVRWNDGYIDKASTSTINGVFIVLVFLSHFAQYAPVACSNLVGRYLGQLIVVPFLFYSGYGCYVQYAKRGKKYLKEFPVKRVLPTLVNFDIAICFFALTALLIGNAPALRTLLLSFIGWESVGNSNWYIFAIILCYLAFWLSFSLVPKTVRGGVLFSLLGVVVLALSLVKPVYWYDTIMSFGSGVIYGMYRPVIEPMVKKRYWLVVATLAAVLCAFAFSPILGRLHLLTYNFYGVVFALFVVVCSMRIRFSSPVFKWCGEHLFPLYIYQRIPMIIFSALHPAAFEDWRCSIYLVLSAFIAIIVASLYPRFRFAI